MHSPTYLKDIWVIIIPEPMRKTNLQPIFLDRKWIPPPFWIFSGSSSILEKTGSPKLYCFSSSELVVGVFAEAGADIRIFWHHTADIRILGYEISIRWNIFETHSSESVFSLWPELIRRSCLYGATSARVTLNSWQLKLIDKWNWNSFSQGLFKRVGIHF